MSHSSAFRAVFCAFLLVGGLVLIGIGLKILLEGLGLFG